MKSAKVYRTDDFARGAFDGGRITEIKPIGFPQDGSTLKRVGPLFYWAWASAEGTGKIDMHPHSAFEIMSYVFKGDIGHRDTLENQSRVSSGGAQIMQAGNGILHEEETFGQTEFFQIWFEPHLEKALRKRPTYQEFGDRDFPRRQNGTSVEIKTLLGPESPAQLQVDVLMWDLAFSAPNATIQLELAAGRSWVGLIMEGALTWTNSSQTESLQAKELIYIDAKTTEQWQLTTEMPRARLALIEVPTEVDYPLYPLRK